MSHTPGPWTAKRTSVSACGIRISQSGYVGGASVQCEEAAQRMREANATLIAAAPDLLSACNYAADKLRDCLEWDESGERVRGAMIALEAAIAKATPAA